MNPAETSETALLPYDVENTASDVEKTDLAALNAGHRSRLRRRLLSGGGDDMADYELLELLLFTALPRRDVKPLAKKLLAEFGDLWKLINTKPERLMAQGIGESVVSALITIKAVSVRALRTEIIGKPLLKSWTQIVNYCRAAMGVATEEHFRIIFLDRRNRVIADEVQQRGSIDHTPVYPREVVRRALELSAGAIVLAHNHPSGDLRPSTDDITITRNIVEACRPLGIVIHDHLIIGREDTVSFKSLGLL